MSFYHDSSSSGRVGGKSYSPAEKKRRREFYYDALLHAPYPSGILYLVRHIRKDSCLDSYIHRSACIRSQTFPGIASAMAAQWGCFV